MLQGQLAMQQIIHGDCIEVMARMEPGSIDSICSDPPYGIAFMGKEWDTVRSAFQVESNNRPGGWSFGGRPGHVSSRYYQAGKGYEEWTADWARQALRVIKPGGHMLCFGGTRTWHRLACGLEEAGWELRDTLMWLYGSGFPKSFNLAVAAEKVARGHPHGGADPASPNHGRLLGGHPGAGPGQWLKPGLSVSARPPEARSTSGQYDGLGTALKPAWEPVLLCRKPVAGTILQNVQEHGTGAVNIAACRTDTGRWPANVVLDEESAGLLDEQSGIQRDGVAVGGARSSSVTRKVYGRFAHRDGAGDHGYGGSGGVSRFFYCAKASKAERGEGNNHPTVKPLALCSYLIRLITPEYGTVLDPFLGSGTTVVAAKLENRSAVGIEKELEYVEIARRRLEHGSA